MSLRLASRRSAVVGLAFTTVVAGGIAAYAYPPGTDLTVSATATADSPTEGTITVTIANANPNCGFTVRVDGANPAEQILAAGASTATFMHVTGGGDHDVRVHAYNCVKGEDKEHARTSVVVPRGSATPRDAAAYNDYFRIDVTGVQNDAQISLMATAPNGTVITDLDTANTRGEGKVKVRLNQHGNWSIIVTADGSQIGSFTPHIP